MRILLTCILLLVGRPLLADFGAAVIMPEPTAAVFPVIAPEPVMAQLATGEAAHTPMAEVVRVLGLLPKPEIAFVDFGCGFDARWCVAAAEKWAANVSALSLIPKGPPPRATA